MDLVKSVIKKEGSKYCIFSKNGKKLSCHDTREDAVKRLRQIEFFKRQKAAAGEIVVHEAPEVPTFKATASTLTPETAIEKFTTGKIKNVWKEDEEENSTTEE